MQVLLASTFAAAAVELVPHSLCQLTLPLYGREHLLLFERQHDEARLLPALLCYADGAELARVPGAASSNTLGGGAALWPHRATFEAAIGRSLALWDLARLANGRRDVPSALLALLRSESLVPRRTVLGPARVAASGVRMRDLGAFTGAAPSSVRLDELGACLECSRGCSPAAAEGEPVALPLASAALAVLLHLHAAQVPIVIAAADWERLATTEAKLPPNRIVGGALLVVRSK